MKSILILLFLILNALTPVIAKKLVIGVLAIEPSITQELEVQALEKQITDMKGDYKISIVSLNYAELNKAVKNSEIDFILTDPVHYIQLSHSSGVSSPLVTRITQYNSQSIYGFGGVIVINRNRSDITSLNALSDLTIAISKQHLLGNFLAQSFELSQHNIDTFKTIAYETQNEAVISVINNETDAAFVHTGLLELMNAQNLIDINQITTLNPQAFRDFPLLVSTRLYPEWPLVAMRHVSELESRKVTGILLSLPVKESIPQTGIRFSFSTPADYQSVHKIMQELKISPYDIKTKITWQDIWLAHKHTIQAISLSILIIFLLSLLLVFLNLKLKTSMRTLKENESALRLAAVAFETQSGILITDKDEKILSINNSFSEITGYQLNEIQGKTPRIFKSNCHDKSFFQSMWNDLISKGSWEGEIWNKRKNGEIYPEMKVINTVKDKQGQITHYLTSFIDITERKLTEEKIYTLAFYDPLTGLANRRLLEDRIQQALLSMSRDQHYCALIFIDLDKFKNLNDTLGHKMGDELLKQVAQRLKTTVRESDTVARPGGDEFIILLSKLDKNKIRATRDSQLVGKKLLLEFNQAFDLLGTPYNLTASIGIHLFFDPSETADELMKRSDLAMYKAKQEGRNNLQFFDSLMEEAASERAELESKLRQALQNSEFELYFEPKLSHTFTVIGYEALIRWNHPIEGTILPKNFIPIAEETGLILPMGEWVLDQACQKLQTWYSDTSKSHLTISINISHYQLAQKDFVEKTINTISSYRFNPYQLEFEITESMIMNDVKGIIAKMAQLKKIGILFSLDDFGTGYSSLSHLKTLPINCLKIDQSFVHDMLIDDNSAAIVKTIITLSKTLKLDVIAEGVETQQQVDRLIELGCDFFQGYFFEKQKNLDLKSYNRGK